VEQRPRGGSARLGLVAALADQAFAVADVGGRAHGLDGQPALVEGLEEEFAMGRHFEVGAASASTGTVPGPSAPAPPNRPPRRYACRSDAAARRTERHRQQLQNAEMLDVCRLRQGLMRRKHSSIPCRLPWSPGLTESRLAAARLAAAATAAGPLVAAARTQTADIRVAIDQFLVAEAVHQVKAVGAWTTLGAVACAISAS